jgi:hypothetical protein
MKTRARFRLGPVGLVLTFVCGGCGGGGDRGTPDAGGASGSGGRGGAAGQGGEGGADGAGGRGGAGGRSGDAGASGSGGRGGASGAGGAPGSVDAATGDEGGVTPAPLDAAASDAADAPPRGATKGTPTFVAVGYGGVRVRSLDLGKTWIDAQRLGGGGDDNFLLRTIAFGQGLFVALGWQLHTSPDGKTWTMRAKDAGQWMGGVRFGDGRFVAAGGYGESTYSIDGLTWPKGGGRMTDAARSVAFGDGLWVARADSNHWWQTRTGETWTDLGGAHGDDVAFCGGQFVDAKTCPGPAGHDGGRVAFGENVWVGIKDGKIERSEDGGTSWKIVYTASDALEDVAFGDVTP